jgi:hypothetical protein
MYCNVGIELNDINRLTSYIVLSLIPPIGPGKNQELGIGIRQYISKIFTNFQLRMYFDVEPFKTQI